jgi:hypothetical protein
MGRFNYLQRHRTKGRRDVPSQGNVADAEQPRLKGAQTRNFAIGASGRRGVRASGGAFLL